jgi:TRAP-type mannitol/chloroaromatic compound transport system permease small subunit
MLNKVVATIDALNRSIANAVSWLVVIMVLTMFSIVLMRYIFNEGSIFFQESITYMHGLVFMLAIAHILQTDGHVRVDILYQRWGTKGKAIVNLLGSIFLLLPICSFVLYISWDYVAASWSYYEGSREAGGIDGVYMLKSLIPIMAILLLLQGISESLKAIQTLMRKGYGR